MPQTFDAGHRTLTPSSSPRPLPTGAPVDLDDLVVVPSGHPSSTARSVAERWSTRSLVVVHRGELVVDWIADGHDPTRPQRCYSVTKSMTGTILAELVAVGSVARSDQVGDVVAPLAPSGFGDATVGDVLDMTVELAYVEDYAEIAGGSSGGAGHDFGDYVVALGLEEPGAVVRDGAARTIRDLLTRIGRGEGAHGSAFHYATPVTDVAGWIIETVTGRDPVDLIVERIWVPSGAEHAARWSTDRAGTASAGAGLEATTHDLARIGVLLGERARGEGPDDAVSPAALADAMRGGSTEAFAADGHYAYLSGYSYRDQWWIPTGPNGAFSGWGIYGQFLWVDPTIDMVVACHCRGVAPSDPHRDLDQHALCEALRETLAAR